MKRFTMLLAALSILLVAGCSTPSVKGSLGILELDTRLRQLLEQAPSTAVSADLEKLAAQASAQGDAALDAPSAVSFYRVAAMAAWGAGPARNSALVPVSIKGDGLCANLPGGAGGSRDCAIFRLAPTLASLDGQSVKAGEIRDTHPTDVATQVSQGTDLAVGIYQNIEQLLELRKSFAELDPAFDRFLETSVNKRSCMVQGLTKVLADRGASAQQIDRIADATQQAEAKMRASHVRLACN
jgi:hypothetical protein